jgi:hypothetical protein
MGDDVNPSRASSGFQFYIVHGKVFNDHELDSIEINRLERIKLPAIHRDYYKNLGGTPQLDQHYTVFGELINGFEVLDSIAATKTTGKRLDHYVDDECVILPYKYLSTDDYELLVEKISATLERTLNNDELSYIRSSFDKYRLSQDQLLLLNPVGYYKNIRNVVLNKVQ